MLHKLWDSRINDYEEEMLESERDLHQMKNKYPYHFLRKCVDLTKANYVLQSNFEKYVH